MGRRNCCSDLFPGAVLRSTVDSSPHRAVRREDKSVSLSPFFFNQVIDHHGIQPIPAEAVVLPCWIRRNRSLRPCSWGCSSVFQPYGEQRLCILAEDNGSAFECDAGQVTDIAFAPHTGPIGIDIGFRFYSIGVGAFAYAICVNGLTLGGGDDSLS